MHAGQVAGLADRARSIVDEARSLAHPPTLGSALEALAQVQRAENDTPGLTTTINELVQVAAAARDDVQTAGALIELLLVTGRDHHQPDEALAQMPAAEAAVLRAGSPPSLHAMLLSAESAVLAFTPRTKEAIAKSEEAVRVASDALAQSGAASRPARTLALLKFEYNLGVAKARGGALDEALALFRDIVARDRVVYGPAHPEEARAWQGLGNTLSAAEKFDDAIAAFQQAVQIRSQRMGETLALANALTSLGTTLIRAYRFDESLVALEHARKILEARLPPDDPDIAEVIGSLADVLEYQGRKAEGMRLREQQIAMLSRKGADPEFLASAYFNRADTAIEDHRYADAIPDLERADALWVEVQGSDTPMRILSQTRIGQCLVMLGRPNDAIASLTIATTLTTPGTGTYERILAGAYLGRALVDSGRDRRGGLNKVATATVELIYSGDNYIDDVKMLNTWLAATNARGRANP